MRIESSSINLSTKSSNVSEQKVSITSSSWMNELKALNQPDNVPIKTTSRIELSRIRMAYSMESELGLDDRIKKGILEELLGRIYIKDIKLLPNDEQTHQESSNDKLAHNMSEMSNLWGISVNRKVEYYQKNSIEFHTTAKIRTSDNKNIDFNVSFAFSKEFREVHEEQIDLSSENFIDPLIINYKGDVKSFDNISTDLRFSFDLNDDGEIERIPLVKDGSGFLALDKNTNGKIDTGSELFGTKSGNGFADLKEFDNDNNDWIDENDNIFQNLRIWEKTENGEDNLITLAQAGVGAIYLASAQSNFDYHTSVEDKIAHLKQSSFYLKENGQPGLITGVDFIV